MKTSIAFVAQAVASADIGSKNAGTSCKIVELEGGWAHQFGDHLSECFPDRASAVAAAKRQHGDQLVREGEEKEGGNSDVREQMDPTPV